MKHWFCNNCFHRTYTDDNTRAVWCGSCVEEMEEEKKEVKGNESE